MSEKKKMPKLTEEVIDKILLLDCRKEGNIRRLKKSLKKLPIIKNESMMETDGLEEVLEKVGEKFKVSLAYISRTRIDGIMRMTGMIKTDKGKWIKTAYGISVWEIYAKALFIMIYYVESKRNRGGS